MTSDTDGGRGIFGSAIFKGAAIVALLALVGVGAAQMGVLDLGSSGGASDAVKQVPDGVDSVVKVDAEILEDDLTKQFYAETYDYVQNNTDDRARAGASQSMPANLTALYDRAENETGLAPEDLDEVVVFQQHRDGYSEPQYAGAIVHADWNESEFVGTVENSSHVEYENETRHGMTVYRPAEEDDSRFAPDPDWVGVIDDGEYVVGSEAAVNDTLAVAAGEAEPFGGEMLDAYEDTRDGYVRSVERSGNVNLTQLNEADDRTGINLTKYGEEYNNVHMTAGSMYVTDDAIGSETTVYTNATSAAKDVESLYDGVLSIYAGAVQNETLEEELRSVEVERDGTEVHVSRETDLETAMELLRWLFSLSETPGTPAGPIA